MSTQSPPTDLPAVESLVTELIGNLALLSHAYLSDESGRTPDLESAQVAIDVASVSFERVKERLRPQERLAITQMLTETRMTFVKKRGL